jgi:predicted DNA-binding WGR domain protein
MHKNSKDVVLYRIAPTKNMQRFYTLSVVGNLFGGGSLIRSWGRIGKRGQSKIELYDCEVSAYKELERISASKMKRGYD